MMKRLIGMLVSCATAFGAPVFLAGVVAANLTLVSPVALGEEGGAKLEPAPIDVRDIASLQAGARIFVNYCLNCHSASLMRYGRLREIGLTNQQIKDNLMFTADKVGDMMTIAMTPKEEADWIGPAPDLSLIARSRGPDWLWTYLRGFYRDPSSPTGWNNTVFPGVGMPNVLWQLEGDRVLKRVPLKDAAGHEIKDSHGNVVTSEKLVLVKAGSLTPVEFDATVRDLVDYLTWMAEPHQVLRKQVGIWVMFFLAILVALTYALYKEFWKDIH